MAAITRNEHLRGTPVVFIHGITANVDLWGPSLPESIRNGRRWISLSLPGHHPSQIDSVAFGSWNAVTPAVWADWYEQALSQLVGDEPVDVVGWSTGGFSGLTLAVHYPRRVRSLLSISGFATGRWLGWLGFFQRLSLSPLTRWGVPIGIRAVGQQRWLFDRMMASAIGDDSAFHASPIGKQTMQDWFNAFASQDPLVMSELFRKIAQFDFSDQVGRITCPTLIAGGESDPYIPVSHTRWIADHVPKAELVLWPGAGHLFFAERTQEYQELLVRWLDRQGLPNG
ncbi:MAG: alpha/beta hydrolase [Candidatus Saccharimonas sp.]|nr:alpha/beta hydrolase [Planctomycetaceae bacterium]